MRGLCWSVIAVGLGSGASLGQGCWRGVGPGAWTVPYGRHITDFDAADFDGDGIPDIVVSEPPDLVRVWKGDGRGGFEVLIDIELGVGNGLKQVIHGDFDGDGHTDIAAYTFERDVSTNSVLGQWISYVASDGRGSFLDPINVLLDVSIGGIHAADLDGDGRDDVCAYSGSGPIVFYSDASLAAPLECRVAELSTGASMGLRDVDGDGLPDLVVYSLEPGNLDTRGLRTFLSRGRCAWELAGYVPSSSLSGQAVFDLDEDGRMDVAASSRTSDAIEVYFGAAGLGFEDAVAFPVYERPRSVEVVDVDNDGDGDIVVSCWGPDCGFGSGFCDGRLVVLRNGGNRRFEAPEEYRDVVASLGPVFADFSGDGAVDVATVSEGLSPVQVLPGLGNGRFVGPQIVETEVPLRVLSIGDASGDGLADVVLRDSAGESIWLSEKGAGGGYGEPRRVITLPAASWEASVFRFASEGRAGIVVWSGSKVEVWSWADGGVYEFVDAASSSFDNPFWHGIFVGDLDGDGESDLVWSGRDSVSGFRLEHWLGGSLGFVIGYEVLSMADLDDDGDLDFVGRLGAEARLFVLENVSYGETALIDIVELAGEPDDLDIGDLNGDGVSDLIATVRDDNGYGDGIQWAAGIAGGGFAAPSWLDGAGADRFGPRLADFDGDGTLDVIVRDTDANMLRAYFGGSDFGEGESVLTPTMNGFSGFEFEVASAAKGASAMIAATQSESLSFAIAFGRCTSCPSDRSSEWIEGGAGEGYGVPDGRVDGFDLRHFVEAWMARDWSADVTTRNRNPGEAGYGWPDGRVDGADISVFVEAWLAGCE